jgi:hypothetical protein
MIDIRRVFTHVEDIRHEFGRRRRSRCGVAHRRGARQPVCRPLRADILPMMEALQAVGRTWRSACARPWRAGRAIEGYGKGAIVGAAGELEHGALWHVPGGYAMRELLGWKGDRVAYRAGPRRRPASPATRWPSCPRPRRSAARRTLDVP